MNDLDNREEPLPKLAPNSHLLSKILQYPCNSCNSKMHYSAEREKLYCNYCGIEEDFEKASDKVKEIPLHEAVKAMQSFSPQSIDKIVIACLSCHSEIMIQSNEVYIRCSFCGSEKVNKGAYKKNLIQPQGIIPFSISKQAAKDAFNAWIKEGWFRPNSLRTASFLESLKGIYLPFWTFDAATYSEWVGEQGIYYYVTVSRNGKRQRQRRTRWHHKSGSFHYNFDDVLIAGSSNIALNIIENIYPYNLKAVINYLPELMIGWDAQIYNIEIDKAYAAADLRMHNMLYKEASRHLGGDTQRNLQVSSDFSAQTYKHIILPIWICTYTYHGKIYQFAVNGQAGKIEGEKPYSRVKIFLFILFTLSVIVSIVYTSKS